MVVAARSLVERVRIFSDPITLVAVLRTSDIIDPDVALVGSVKTVVGVQVCVRLDRTLAVFELVGSDAIATEFFRACHKCKNAGRNDRKLHIGECDRNSEV